MGKRCDMKIFTIIVEQAWGTSNDSVGYYFLPIRESPTLILIFARKVNLSYKNPDDVDDSSILSPPSESHAKLIWSNKLVERASGS